MKNFWNNLLVSWKVMIAFCCVAVDSIRILFHAYITKRIDKIVMIAENSYGRMDKFMSFYKAHDCDMSRWIIHDFGESINDSWLGTYDIVIELKQLLA